MADLLCGSRCGPIWKLDGEVCVCVEPAGHVERQDSTFGADHLCSCGAWFVDSVKQRETTSETNSSRKV